MREAVTIYWFSGTGNSLAAARRIAQRLEGARLVPIASIEAPQRPDGVVGVVCPVYFEGLPLAVREFLERLDARGATYAFFVVTAGAFAGWAPAQARRLFRRTGRRLDAAFSLRMPDNYISVLDLPPPAKQAEVLGRAEHETREIADAVAERAEHRGIGPAATLGLLAFLTMGRSFARTCRRRDERFVVTDACTGCGLCASVCPKRNIALAEGRPKWSHRCEQCFACVHFCPAAAIQIRHRPTARRRRYHHPDVTAADIGSQAPKPTRAVHPAS